MRRKSRLQVFIMLREFEIKFNDWFTIAKARVIVLICNRSEISSTLNRYGSIPANERYTIRTVFFSSIAMTMKNTTQRHKTHVSLCIRKSTLSINVRNITWNDLYLFFTEELFLMNHTFESSEVWAYKLTIIPIFLFVLLYWNILK